MPANQLLLIILAVLAALFTGAGAVHLLTRSEPEAIQQEAAKEPAREAPAQAATSAAPSASQAAKPVAPQRPATRTPKYDVVRIEKGGEGVIAGKAEPGWRVIVEAGGTPVAEATADRDGEWAVVLTKPLPAGEHSLSLHAYSPDGNRGLVSDQTVVVSVAGKASDETVVALAEPGKPTQVLQREQAKAESEVAKAPPAKPEATQPAAAASEPAKPQPAAPAAPATSSAPAQPAAPQKAAAPQQAPAPQKAATPEQAPAPQQAAAPVATPPLPGPAEQLASTPPVIAQPPEVKVAANEPAKAAPPQEVAKPAAPSAPATAEQARTAETTVAKSTPAPAVAPSQPATVPEPKTAPSRQIASAQDQQKSQEKLPPDSTASTAPAPAKPAPSTQVARAVPADERPKPAEQPAIRPAAPKTQVVFDAVDYEEAGEAGQVFLSGEAEPGARLQIYLNNELIAEAKAGADGKWTVAHEQHLEPGSYVLRADQVREGGKVVSRAEVTFERAAPQAVVASLAEAEREMKAKAAGQAVGQAIQQAAAPSAAGPEQAAAEKPVKRRTRYLVRRGDTLWDIAEQIYGKGWRYTAIYQRNRGQIRDPDLIYPNQRFRVP